MVQPRWIAGYSGVDNQTFSDFRQTLNQGGACSGMLLTAGLQLALVNIHVPAGGWPLPNKLSAAQFGPKASWMLGQSFRPHANWCDFLCNHRDSNSM